MILEHKFTNRPYILLKETPGGLGGAQFTVWDITNNRVQILPATSFNPKFDPRIHEDDERDLVIEYFRHWQTSFSMERQQENRRLIQQTKKEVERELGINEHEQQEEQGVVGGRRRGRVQNFKLKRNHGQGEENPDQPIPHNMDEEDYPEAILRDEVLDIEEMCASLGRFLPEDSRLREINNLSLKDLKNLDILPEDLRKRVVRYEKAICVLTEPLVHFDNYPYPIDKQNIEEDGESSPYANGEEEQEVGFEFAQDIEDF